MLQLYLDLTFIYLRFNDCKQLLFVLPSYTRVIFSRSIAGGLAKGWGVFHFVGTLRASGHVLLLLLAAFAKARRRLIALQLHTDAHALVSTLQYTQEVGTIKRLNANGCASCSRSLYWLGSLRLRLTLTAP
jgi:hypothetical protein